MTKIYFDTEFTGLHKDTTLISIGLISDTGKVFYAELNDYDASQVDEWLRDNIIENLKFNDLDSYYGLNEDFIEIKNDSKYVGKMLKEWLNQFDKVEFVSDVCHYDFVLFIDLVYGHALNMPYGIINASCHDINQDIASFYGIPEIEAFDKSRESILEDLQIKVEGEKHNALYDAKVIKGIYEEIIEIINK